MMWNDERPDDSVNDDLQVIACRKSSLFIVNSPVTTIIRVKVLRETWESIGWQRWHLIPGEVPESKSDAPKELPRLLIHLQYITAALVLLVGILCLFTVTEIVSAYIILALWLAAYIVTMITAIQILKHKNNLLSGS